MIFSIEEEHLIKIGYLKWKKPTEIAKFLDLQPLSVHNYIQAHHISWQNEKPFCYICNDSVEKHLRCSLCESFVHDQIINGKTYDWYKLYHNIDETIVCNYCIATLGVKHFRKYLTTI